MVLPIDHEHFSGRGFGLLPATFLKPARIVIDGKEIEIWSGEVLVQDNAGNQVPIGLKGSFLEPIPKVVIAGQTIVIARPPAWYEYVWIGLPLLLVFSGAIGAMVAFAAIGINLPIFRSSRSATMKFLLSGVVSLTAFVIVNFAGIIIHAVLSQP